MRAIGSVPPPGGKGTMNLIGPLGHSACALTMEGAAMAEPMPVSTARRYICVMHGLRLFLVLRRACRQVSPPRPSIEPVGHTLTVMPSAARVAVAAPAARRAVG